MTTGSCKDYTWGLINWAILCMSSKKTERDPSIGKNMAACDNYRKGF